jgi:hypothetical protein
MFIFLSLSLTSCSDNNIVNGNGNPPIVTTDTLFTLDSLGVLCPTGFTYVSNRVEHELNNPSVVNIKIEFDAVSNLTNQLGYLRVALDTTRNDHYYYMNNIAQNINGFHEIQIDLEVWSRITFLTYIQNNTTYETKYIYFKNIKVYVVN